ncbi:MAG: delta-60 repeat domain-containing protein, partial [Flavobacteriales bacterium]
MRQHLLISVSLAIASICSAQDAVLDPTFTPGAGPNSIPYDFVELASGKLLVLGTHNLYDSVPSLGVTRITSDGVLDPTFDVGIGSGGFTVSHGLELQDGRIFIIGGFQNFGGYEEADQMAMLLPDGTTDTSFHTSGVTTNGLPRVVGCVLQPDGKILISGRFDTYNGVARVNMARIYPDGSLDTSFDPGLSTGTAVSSQIDEMVLLPNGQLLITGRFSTYNGVPRKSIVRINPDGSLDPSFDAGTATTSEMSACAVQPDGKILIGGNFLSFNGVEGNKVARLNADGSVDTSFNAGNSATGSEPYGVWVIIPQADGKMLISGRFTSFFNGSMAYLARLMPDGSGDPTFVQGTGFNNWVRIIHQQSNGKLLVGQTATEYNGTAIGKLVRLFTGAEVGIEEPSASAMLALYPNPT